MKQLKKFKVLCKCGDDYFEFFVPSENKKKAIEFCQGNGEVITVWDVTDDIFISLDNVSSALNQYGFNDTKIDLILRTLSQTRIAE